MADRVLAELKKLTSKPLLYLVNTSADSDHVGGNDVFSKGSASRGGANNGPRAAEVNIYAQDNAAHAPQRAGGTYLCAGSSYHDLRTNEGFHLQW